MTIHEALTAANFLILLIMVVMMISNMVK